MGSVSEDRYELLAPIGQGNYGVLYRGTDHEAKSDAERLIAAKTIREPCNSPIVLRELGIQRAMSGHPHIVPLLDVVARGPTEVLLVMEFLPINLREFMTAFACVHRPPLVERQEPFIPLVYIKTIMRGLLSALAALHVKGIVHRDVKPENILVEPMGAERPLRMQCPPNSTCAIHSARHTQEAAREREACGSGVTLHHEMGKRDIIDEISRAHCAPCMRASHAEAHTPVCATVPLSPHVKLGDFGTARSVAAVKVLPPSGQREMLTGNPTTLEYSAPEIMLGHSYSEPVDLWAVGVIFFELITGLLLIPIGSLFNFNGTVGEENDFSVAHRLVKLIYLLGTPTPEEWACIASEEQCPVEVLQSLPQVSSPLLFSSPGGAALRQDSSPVVELSSAARLSAALPRLAGTDGVDLLRSLLRYSPQQRLTASAALQHPFFH